MKWIATAVAVVSLCSSGCSSLDIYRDTGRTVGQRLYGLPSAPRESDDELVQKELQATFKICKEQLTQMEGSSYRQRKTSLWVYGIGLVAGSVIAPGLAAANAAKHAGVIAGLAGTAGAAGLAGRALEQTAMSGGAMAADRNEVAKTIRDQTAIAMTPGDLSSRLGAVRKMEAACIAYNITVPGAVGGTSSGGTVGGSNTVPSGSTQPAPAPGADKPTGQPTT